MGGETRGENEVRREEESREGKRRQGGERGEKAWAGGSEEFACPWRVKLCSLMLRRPGQLNGSPGHEGGRLSALTPDCGSARQLSLWPQGGGANEGKAGRAGRGA